MANPMRMTRLDNNYKAGSHFVNPSLKREIMAVDNIF
jgi:hypothetical protein